MITIGPNKRMAWISFLLSTLIFFLGLYEFMERSWDSWHLLSIIHISGRTLGFSLMLFLPISVFALIYVYRTKKRIYLDSESVILFDNKKINLLRIDKVTVCSINFVKTGVEILDVDGNKFFVPSLQIDGITKFADLLCEKINEKTIDKRIMVETKGK